MSFIKDTEKNIIFIITIMNIISINIIHPQVSFIKDIKKNTSLSDEDAAIIAASKVRRVFSGRKIFFSGRKYFELYLSVSQAGKVACLCLYLCYKRNLIQHFS